MDFVVSMMLDLSHPVTSVQNAASFGYFDCITHQWNTDILARAGFPAELLPRVVNSGETAGCLPQDWFDVPAGTPVRSDQYYYTPYVSRTCRPSRLPTLVTGMSARGPVNRLDTAPRFLRICQLQ